MIFGTKYVIIYIVNTKLRGKTYMNFQTHYDRYLQNIHRTQITGEATPELSLYPHLQAFLEDLFVDFGRSTVTLTQEPRQLDQIGRPDFIAMDGLLPIGYIEAEAYGRDLDALTGHAQTQNARFIENLDNFIITKFHGLETQVFRLGRKNRPRVLGHSVFFEKTLDILIKLCFNIYITVADMNSVAAKQRVCLPTVQGLKL